MFPSSHSRKDPYPQLAQQSKAFGTLLATLKGNLTKESSVESLNVVGPSWEPIWPSFVLFSDAWPSAATFCRDGMRQEKDPEAEVHLAGRALPVANTTLHPLFRNFHLEWPASSGFPPPHLSIFISTKLITLKDTLLCKPPIIFGMKLNKLPSGM